MEAHVEKQGEHLNANSNTCNDSTIHLYNALRFSNVIYYGQKNNMRASKVVWSQAVSQQQKYNMEEQVKLQNLRNIAVSRSQAWQGRVAARTCHARESINVNVRKIRQRQ